MTNVPPKQCTQEEERHVAPKAVVSPL
jgi:hypothetical protein